MKREKQQKVIKFPKNRDVARKLEAGDRVKIAEYAGLSPVTIRDMLMGYRRITDNAARAIIRLLKEREELGKALDEIVNQ